MYLGAHVWNAVIQGAFDGSTSGRNLWLGESGALTAAALILFAIVLYKLWPVVLHKPLHALENTEAVELI